jgi:hypothetical protein
MKDPGPAVVSILIGDPEVRLVGTANTSSLKLVGVPNPFSASSVCKLVNETDPPPWDRPSANTSPDVKLATVFVPNP